MSRLIYADALTKRLVELCNKNCPYTAKARNVMCGSCFMGLALEAVEDSPTVEPEPHWIRCSERLPEHSERYLVTAFDGTDRRATVAPYQPRNKTWALTGRMAYWRVLAWMPLPAPYRKEGD